MLIVEDRVPGHTVVRASPQSPGSGADKDVIRELTHDLHIDHAAPGTGRSHRTPLEVLEQGLIELRLRKHRKQQKDKNRETSFHGDLSWRKVEVKNRLNRNTEVWRGEAVAGPSTQRRGGAEKNIAESRKQID